MRIELNESDKGEVVSCTLCERKHTLLGAENLLWNGEVILGSVCLTCFSGGELEIRKRLIRRAEQWLDMAQDFTDAAGTVLEDAPTLEELAAFENLGASPS